jgi:hypothetical protein
MEMKFAINMDTQILNKIWFQYTKISESVLIIENLRLPCKRKDSNFIELCFIKFAEHHLCTFNCVSKQSPDDLIVRYILRSSAQRRELG